MNPIWIDTVCFWNATYPWRHSQSPPSQISPSVSAYHLHTHHTYPSQDFRSHICIVVQSLRWGEGDVKLSLDFKPQCVRLLNPLSVIIFLFFFFFQNHSLLILSPLISSSSFPLSPRTPNPLLFPFAYCIICLRAHTLRHCMSARLPLSVLSTVLLLGSVWFCLVFVSRPCLFRLVYLWSHLFHLVHNFFPSMPFFLLSFCLFNLSIPTDILT